MLKFHDQVIGILQRDVEKTRVSEKKLQYKLDKVEKKLKQEKTIVKAKHNKVKEYEHKIIHLGSHPNNEATIKSVLTDKDKEILNLKRKLKIPEIQMVQTLELLLEESENERLVKQIEDANQLAQDQQYNIILLEA